MSCRFLQDLPCEHVMIAALLRVRRPVPVDAVADYCLVRGVGPQRLELALLRLQARGLVVVSPDGYVLLKRT